MAEDTRLGLPRKLATYASWGRLVRPVVKVERVQLVGGGPPCSICRRDRIERLGLDDPDGPRKEAPLPVVMIEIEGAPTFVVCRWCESIAALAAVFRNNVDRSTQLLQGGVFRAPEDTPFCWRCSRWGCPLNGVSLFVIGRGHAPAWECPPGTGCQQ